MLKHQGNMKWYSIYNDDPVQQHVLMNTPRGYECVRVRMISTWFILINLVCLCLPEVLLSARASPSPNKVQGCNDCMLSCKHLFMERVCAVCDHVTDKISTLTPADSLPKRSSFFIYFFFYIRPSFLFFTNSAVQMNALYSHSITRHCNTLWGTNKTLKKK